MRFQNRLGVWRRVALAVGWTVCLAGALVSAPALALDAVTDAIQAAYPAYRAALFRTNTKSQADAEQAMGKARQDWRSVVERFTGKAVAPYDRDPAFAKTLAEVTVAYERADAQVRENRLAEAHETLEAVRDLLADLRQRNGVVVYSDHMNAYHAEMERLLHDAPKLLSGPQGFLQAMSRLGALEYLAGRLRSQASAEMAKDADFGNLMQGVEKSLSGLRVALLSQDVGASTHALAQLKGPYSRLFMRFG